MAFTLPAVEAAERIPNRIGLIDADCVAYWAAAGCDAMPVQAAKRKVRDRMTAICDQIQTDDIRCYLTGKNNFRNDVATYQMYKGNRYAPDGTRIKPQPKWLSACRDYIQANYNTTMCDGQEADDALAIAQIKCNAADGWESIISSIDKDLLIIPGKHHDMNSGYIQDVDEMGRLFKDEKGKVRGAGLRFFYAQLLMGDSADWIPGLPKVTPEMKAEFGGIKRLGGCGPVAALNALEGCATERELFDRVAFCYKSYWNGERWYKHWKTGEKIYPTWREALTEQGQLLWMRREAGQMWEIPKEFDKWKQQ